MICPLCTGILFIDEWNGWRWTCINCEYDGGYATTEEIDQYEKEMIEDFDNKL